MTECGQRWGKHQEHTCKRRPHIGEENEIHKCHCGVLDKNVVHWSRWLVRSGMVIIVVTALLSPRWIPFPLSGIIAVSGLLLAASAVFFEDRYVRDLK